MLFDSAADVVCARCQGGRAGARISAAGCGHGGGFCSLIKRSRSFDLWWLGAFEFPREFQLLRQALQVEQHVSARLVSLISVLSQGLQRNTAEFGWCFRRIT